MQKHGPAICYRDGVMSSQSRYTSILLTILVARFNSLVPISSMVPEFLTVIPNKPYEKKLFPPP